MRKNPMKSSICIWSWKTAYCNFIHVKIYIYKIGLAFPLKNNCTTIKNVLNKTQKHTMNPVMRKITEYPVMGFFSNDYKVEHNMGKD